MSRFVALYRVPEDPARREQFDRDYRQTHLPLVAKTPGLVRLETSTVRHTLHGSPALHLMALLTFADAEAMKVGLASEEWAAAGRNLAEIGGLDLATMLILDDPEVVEPPG